MASLLHLAVVIRRLKCKSTANDCSFILLTGLSLLCLDGNNEYVSEYYDKMMIR